MNNATNSQKTADKINAIRSAACGMLGAPEHTKCTSCGQAFDAPFRRNDERGKVIMGCIDASHSGRLYGESLRWHERPEAQTLRREKLAYLRTIGGVA